MAKKQTNVQADTSASTQTQVPGLSLQDLVFVAQLIQLTSQRGAYRAEELKQIGEFYDRLIAFLESTGAISRTPQESKND